MLPKPLPKDKTAFAASVVEVATSRAILLGFLVVALLVVFVLAARLQAPGRFGADQDSTDFDTFYIAGRLAAQGRPEDTYDVRMLMLEQRNLANPVGFMPWTYPPPYLLLVQSLARLPIGVAFAVFVLASFAFYVVVLWRIAGPWLPGIMIGVMPAIVLNLRTGQNGFLMGGAVGLSLLLASNMAHRRAGALLSVLTLKPHLGIGLGLWMLISRRFVSLAIATAVALSGCIVATLFYGAELWPAFLRAANQASGFLAAGYYPQFRMVTVFATLNSLGAGPWLSFLAQGVVAIFAIGAIVWGIARELPFRLQAAIVCASTLSISPYCYDYDLTILGVGLAFVLPDLIARISRREGLALWLLLWLGCGQGFALNTVFAHVASSSWLGAASDCPSLSAPVLLALYAMCIHVLRRPASEPESYLLAKAQRST